MRSKLLLGLVLGSLCGPVTMAQPSVDPRCARLAQFALDAASERDRGAAHAQADRRAEEGAASAADKQDRVKLVKGIYDTPAMSPEAAYKFVFLPCKLGQR